MLTSRQRQAGWLFAIGCVLLIFGIWLWISSGLPTTAYICDQSPQTHKEECASYNIAFVTVWHVAKFFDDHNGTFSALFAAAVAVLTWYLCKATIGLRESTDKLWDAGERQIKTSRKVAAIQARQTRQAIRESTIRRRRDPYC
jgi:hypothetical protein